MIRVWYKCLRCGYHHLMFENWSGFSPPETLSVAHRDDDAKQPCSEKLLYRVDGDVSSNKS